MITLLLIRHGENDFLHKRLLPGQLPGIHLNERGREQAAALADWLAGRAIAAVYASPLERAIETAAPLAQARRLEIRVVPELADLDVGEWQGRSWKALGRTQAWKSLLRDPGQFRFPGGESFRECQARVLAALDRIAAAHRRGDTAAVVFHADPIKLALAHALGMPIDHFQRLVIATASVSILQQGARTVQLAGVNLQPPVRLPGG